MGFVHATRCHGWSWLYAVAWSNSQFYWGRGKLFKGKRAFTKQNKNPNWYQFSWQANVYYQATIRVMLILMNAPLGSWSEHTTPFTAVFDVCLSISYSESADAKMNKQRVRHTELILAGYLLAIQWSLLSNDWFANRLLIKLRISAGSKNRCPTLSTLFRGMAPSFKLISLTLFRNRNTCPALSFLGWNFSIL